MSQETASGQIGLSKPGTSVALADDQMPANSLLNFVARAVEDPNIDVAKLEALLRMQREIVREDAIGTFNRALRAAQAEIPPIAKNGTIDLGGKGSIPFTTWEDMDKVLRPVMDKHGFTLTFDMQIKDGGGAVITATLLHIDGHRKTASIPLALDNGPGRNNLQSMGSTMMYGRRYTTEMIFNLVRKGVDNDGADHGKKFITEAHADELRALCSQCGRQEGPFLDQLFAGKVRSFDELEEGSGFLAAKSTLEAILRQRAKRSASE